MICAPESQHSFNGKVTSCVIKMQRITWKQELAGEWCTLLGFSSKAWKLQPLCFPITFTSMLHSCDYQTMTPKNVPRCWALIQQQWEAKRWLITVQRENTCREWLPGCHRGDDRTFGSWKEWPLLFCIISGETKPKILSRVKLVILFW